MNTNYENILEATKNRVLSLVELKPENQWEQDSNKDGTLIHTKMNPENGLKINRIETTTTLDPEQFVYFVADALKKKDYDTGFEEIRLVQKIDNNTNIYYIKRKSPMVLVDARDLCTISRVYNLGNGAFMTISTSIEHPEVPPVKGVQRAEMVFQSNIVRKLPNGQVNIVNVAHMNPKGDIPKAMINAGTKMQAEGFKLTLEHWQKINKK